MFRAGFEPFRGVGHTGDVPEFERWIREQLSIMPGSRRSIYPPRRVIDH